MMEIGLVSHWFPSMGDPRKMPIDLFNGLAGAWHRVAALSRGEASERDVMAWRAEL